MPRQLYRLPTHFHVHTARPSAGKLSELEGMSHGVVVLSAPDLSFWPDRSGTAFGDPSAQSPQVKSHPLSGSALHSTLAKTDIPELSTASLAALGAENICDYFACSAARQSNLSNRRRFVRRERSRFASADSRQFA